MKRIQTRVSSDLAKYTENFFFGMSLKQTLLCAAGVTTVAATYICLPGAGMASIGLGMPFFVLGFFRPDGLSAEKWAAYFIRSNFIRPRNRPHEPENEIYDLLWNGRLKGKQVMTKKELRSLRAEDGREVPDGKKKKGAVERRKIG